MAKRYRIKATGQRLLQGEKVLVVNPSTNETNLGHKYYTLDDDSVLAIADTALPDLIDNESTECRIEIYEIACRYTEKSVAAKITQALEPLIANAIAKKHSEESKKPEIGDFYRHYKGSLYRIIGRPKNAFDGEPVSIDYLIDEVVWYQSIEQPGQVWVRSLSDFLESVEVEVEANGIMMGQIVPRFKYDEAKSLFGNLKQV